MNYDEIPEANSRDVCLHILHQKRTINSNRTNYRSATGQHNCTAFLFGKWPSGQHNTGLEINAYWQYVKPNTGEKCSGIIKTGMCFEYVVLKEVCIILEVDPNSNSTNVDWKFNWGCYEGGAITQYEKAKPGLSYDFSTIKFEIKFLNDPTNFVDESLIKNI